jgi:hypothetical protein
MEVTGAPWSHMTPKHIPEKTHHTRTAWSAEPVTIRGFCLLKSPLQSTNCAHNTPFLCPASVLTI